METLVRLFQISIYLFSLSINLFAQNTAPEVTNVTFTQRTDGSFMVDVYFDLNDADGDEMTVTMQVSDDAGSTFNFIAEQISGDIGENIPSGTGKHIVWDFGDEHPQTYSDQIQIKIIAVDNFEGPKTETVTDIDGNVYKTVKIGDQWWMAENLKVTHYRNGDAIPNVTDNTEWTNLTTGANCAYNNDNGNIETYGLLYNWYAVDDSRNIAPEGWHIPTDEEWKKLEIHLGMSKSEANEIDWRGASVGGKLKETGTSHWFSPNTGATNESEFTALPGAYRPFFHIGKIGYWWSSIASDSSNAWYRSLLYFRSDIRRNWLHKYFGFSIRCVKD
ncbi:MAG: hypothetical protein D8M58_04125 [Calditrichaeota bacterium]|nr:MAG: hypothetical protein DWQ03_02950 [Calditrichota bacterium]MBL1204556.1 hypothetical protein [Calditrichota bacterium]NOG44384.1 hypothetical protein [Calditrichota bacterium]